MIQILESTQEPTPCPQHTHTLLYGQLKTEACIFLAARGCLLLCFGAAGSLRKDEGHSGLLSALELTEDWAFEGKGRGLAVETKPVLPLTSACHLLCH